MATDATTNDAIAVTELRVTVEMGDDYAPSPELQSALNDLRDALANEADEVAGFGFTDPVRNITFTLGSHSVTHEATAAPWDGKYKLPTVVEKGTGGFKQ